MGTVTYARHIYAHAMTHFRSAWCLSVLPFLQPLLFPFRHFDFAFCFSMYLAILLSGARQKFFKRSSSLFAPSSSSLRPVPPQ